MFLSSPPASNRVIVAITIMAGVLFRRGPVAVIVLALCGFFPIKVYRTYSKLIIKNVLLNILSRFILTEQWQRRQQRDMETLNIQRLL